MVPFGSIDQLVDDELRRVVRIVGGLDEVVRDRAESAGRVLSDNSASCASCA
jgi:hypothetical protein